MFQVFKILFGSLCFFHRWSNLQKISINSGKISPINFPNTAFLIHSVFSFWNSYYLHVDAFILFSMYFTDIFVQLSVLNSVQITQFFLSTIFSTAMFNQLLSSFFEGLFFICKSFIWLFFKSACSCQASLLFLLIYKSSFKHIYNIFFWIVLLSEVTLVLSPF